MEVAADTFLLIQKRVLCATLEQRKKRKNKKEPTQRQGRGKRAFPSIYSRSVQLLVCPVVTSLSTVGLEEQRSGEAVACVAGNYIHPNEFFK